ncbi:nucleotidyltransferase family protein [Roseomonas elaeocarpi]|uniref:Nucleotidyltransferase family protein n=1 Tax=Roseomonas elaeocarpi TaxID=907779 RepID=A0ABV6JVM7_9PROT
MIDLRTAMVLAAGQGTRMRPLSESVPKPLLRLAGQPLLTHILDRLEEAGVERVVVNAHHLAEQVEAACVARETPRCEVIVEPVLRGTGGGVLGALPRLQALAAESQARALAAEGVPAEGALFTEGPWPFAVVNGDSYWLNGPRPALRRLAERFEAGEMDGLLLLARSATAEAEVGIGDFAMDPLGRLRRPKEFEVVPYTFAGVQILHPRLFRDPPEGDANGAFSLNRLYDRAIEAGRLWGLVHDGAWFHLSRPADLDHAEERLAQGLVRFF